jgi:hypothetical protein
MYLGKYWQVFLSRYVEIDQLVFHKNTYAILTTRFTDAGVPGLDAQDPIPPSMSAAWPDWSRLTRLCLLRAAPCALGPCAARCSVLELSTLRSPRLQRPPAVVFYLASRARLPRTRGPDLHVGSPARLDTVHQALSPSRDPARVLTWPDPRGAAEMAVFACDFSRLQPRAGLPPLSPCPGAGARRTRPLSGSTDDAQDRHRLREASLAQRDSAAEAMEED